MSFTAATAVTPMDGDATRCSGTIEPGWDIVGNANGGYLLALAARAGSQAAGGLCPATVTGHFLNPGKPGPVSIGVVIEKEAVAGSSARGGDQTTPFWVDSPSRHHLSSIIN